jgi:hypothetical protein
VSKLSEDARDAAKSKAERLVRSDPKQRVDASGYSPEGAMNADAITGERPVSRRQYRRGGKVAGEASVARADRKPRASGGRSLTADSLINRDVKEANRERGGLTHDGGMKKGGRIGKTMGGLALPNWADAVARKSGGRAGKLMGGGLAGGQIGLRPGPTGSIANQAMAAQGQPAAAPVASPMIRPMQRKDGGRTSHASGCECARCGGGRVGKKAGGAINDGTRPVGGRLARKGGGRAKKGTNVNIIITQPGGAAKPPMPMGAPPPGAPPPMGLRQGMPPAPPPGAMAPPPGAPPPGMPRASGGRTNDGFGGKLAAPGKYPIDAGAGGGLGRLEKARAARP